MKKTILLMLLLCSCIIATAQESKFGVKGGVNFASLSGDDTDGTEGRTNFHFGIVGNFGISELLAIQPEIFYSAQGFGAEDLDDVVTQLDYINVPILLDIRIVEGLSAQIGPQVGFNINSQLTNGDDSVDLDEVETLDVGGVLGAQFELENGLFFQARYALGFTEIVTDSEVQNAVFSLSVGYFIF